MSFFWTHLVYAPSILVKGHLSPINALKVQDTNQVLQQEKDIENGKDKGNPKLKA